ncbi:MAG: ferredoxin domain-containing protein [Pelotomaculum sp.]
MENILQMVAGLMELSARTAPKTAGQDYVVSKVISGADLLSLAEAMERYGQEQGRTNYDRDANNIRNSGAVLLLGLEEAKPAGLNCGACGKNKCGELIAREGTEFKGPLCAWRLIDLGIALGSAAKTASILNADNRMMYRVGVVARKMGMMKGDLIVGIPLAATGKNIYFDRK